MSDSQGLRLIECLDSELLQHVAKGMADIAGTPIVDGTKDLIEVIHEIKANDFNCVVAGLTASRLISDPEFTPYTLLGVVELLRYYNPKFYLLAVIEDEYPEITTETPEALYLGWLTDDIMNPLLANTVTWPRSKAYQLIGEF